MTDTTDSSSHPCGPRFTALIMAGSRPSGDPLATAMGVPLKALIPVAGVPMLTRVVSAVMESRHIGRIIICGLDRAQADLPPRHSARVEHITAAASPGASAAKAIRELGLTAPILITTADHPLLTNAMVDEMCAAALPEHADVSFGLAAAEPVARIFPGIRRTHHRFRDGTFCGCNLFGLLTPAGCGAPTLWMKVERHRKKPWRLISLLGAGAVIRYFLGRLALADITALGKARLGLQAQPVILSDAVAGFDVDTVAQRDAAEVYLNEGRGAAS